MVDALERQRVQRVVAGHVAARALHQRPVLLRHVLAADGVEQHVAAHARATALGQETSRIVPAQVAVRATDAEAQVLLLAADGQGQRVRPLPAAIAVEAGLTLRPFRVEGYLAGLAKTVSAEPWPDGAARRTVQFLEGEQAAAAGALVGAAAG